MKALSIRAPWWWYILHGGKDIENRGWPTRFRGPVLVHASKTIVRQELKDDLSAADDILGYTGHGVPLHDWRAIHHGELLNPRWRGAIVGTVDIVDCVRCSESHWFFGPIGFVLANPVAFNEPIPFKGALGLFDVPDDLVRNAVPVSL